MRDVVLQFADAHASVVYVLDWALQRVMDLVWQFLILGPLLSAISLVVDSLTIKIMLVSPCHTLACMYCYATRSLARHHLCPIITHRSHFVSIKNNEPVWFFFDVICKLPICSDVCGCDIYHEYMTRVMCCSGCSLQPPLPPCMAFLY